MPESDIVLKEAVELAEKLYWDDYFNNTDEKQDIDIPSYQRNLIYKLINASSKVKSDADRSKIHSRKRLKAVLIAAILIILLTVAAFAVTPIRNFFVNVFSDCTEFVFQNKRVDDYLYAEYAYIPDGYKLDSVINMKTSQDYYYKNGNLRINIGTLQNKGSKVVIDTENAETGEIIINESVGFYSITDTAIILLWSSGKYNHCITADIDENNITLDDIVKIAQSRQPVS